MGLLLIPYLKKKLFAKNADDTPRILIGNQRGQNQRKMTMDFGYREIRKYTWFQPTQRQPNL